MALRSFQLLHVASEPRRPLCGRQACRSARQLAGVRVRRNLTAAVLKPRRADQSAAGVVGKEKTTCTRGSKGAGSQCDADRRLRLERSRESTPGQDDCASPSCRSSEERLLDADVLDGARDYPELAAESAGSENIKDVVSRHRQQATSRMCCPLSWPRPRSVGTSEHLHGSRQVVGDEASREGKHLKRLEKQRGLLEGIWSDDNKRVRGLILLNLLTVLMATNWVIVKDAESALDPMTFAALRFGIAAVGFLPFLRQGMSDEAVRNAGLELGCWSAAGYLTQAVGLMSSDASRASFLSALTVVLVPIFAGLSGRGVRPLTWASALAAVLGVALLGGDSKAPDAGDVWNILSAVFFALQVFRTEVHSREVGTHVAKPLMAVIVTTTVAIAFAADAATHWQQLMSTSLPTLLQSWWAEAPQLPMKELLYTGLLSTDLVLLIELVALSDVSSSEAAIIYTLEPVLGGLLGIVVLHEGSHWGPLGWAGATVIVSTSLITQLASNNDKGLGK